MSSKSAQHSVNQRLANLYVTGCDEAFFYLWANSLAVCQERGCPVDLAQPGGKPKLLFPTPPTIIPKV